MQTIATFEVNTILDLAKNTDSKIQIAGFFVKKSQRLINILNNRQCNICGCEGTLFALERFSNETPHLNLYSIKDGKRILMCSNHRTPKAKGGFDSVDNLRTLCISCNNSLHTK